MTIPMEATEQYVPVVQFIMLYKVVVSFESVDEILIKGVRSNASLPRYTFSMLHKVMSGYYI